MLIRSQQLLKNGFLGAFLEGPLKDPLPVDWLEKGETEVRFIAWGVFAIC